MAIDPQSAPFSGWIIRDFERLEKYLSQNSQQSLQY